MKLLKYETKVTLFNSYFDFNNKLKPMAILSIFQDVASVHGEQIGVGYEAMLNKNLYWVLSRVKYNIIKHPQINQEVKVITWPHEKGRIDFDRDFLILNNNNEVLIKGCSKWCIINTVNRSLARTDDVNYNGEIWTEVNYTDKFNKSPTFEIEGLTPKFSYVVNFSDLDHNQHMNNTIYANLIYNAITNKNVNNFQINFISECKLNDCINVFYNNENLVCGYCNNKLVFTAEVN